MLGGLSVVDTYRVRRPYGKAPYHEIGGPGGHLARLRPFGGNSMSAEWDRGTYWVFSYGTLIAWYDPYDGTLNVNETRYSVTTSRHQSLASAWTGRDYLNLDGTHGRQYEVVW